MLQRLIDRLSPARRSRAGDTVNPGIARARVRRGAAYLDASDPGWRDRIDAGSLELSDGAHCVLGQLHGEFRAGLLRTRIWDASSAPNTKLFGVASPEELGFFAIKRFGEEIEALDYALLNQAWLEEMSAGRSRGEKDLEALALA